MYPHNPTRPAPRNAEQRRPVVREWYGYAPHRVSPPATSAQAVLPWRRDVATPYDEKPEPSGRTIVLELDERWHIARKNRASSGFGKR